MAWVVSLVQQVSLAMSAPTPSARNMALLSSSLPLTSPIVTGRGAVKTGFGPDSDVAMASANGGHFADAQFRHELVTKCMAVIDLCALQPRFLR